MLLATVICLAGLAPGIATGWYLRHQEHGWPLALTAGAGVTLAMPFLLVATLAAFPAIGFAAAAAACIAALYAYDKGRVWVAGAYAAAAFTALYCATWNFGSML